MIQKLPDSNEFKTAFFTGHRSLEDTDISVLKQRILEQIQHAYELGYRRFYCGGARGFDTLAALETIHFRREHPDVVLCLAIPCAAQDKKWPEEDRILYRQILSQADEKAILSPEYFQGCMQARNIYMADRSSLCICFLTHMKGGTASTVRYALSRNLQIINVAVPCFRTMPVMKELSWNYTFIFRSAGKNAAIVPSFLLSEKKLKRKITSP